MIKFSFILFVTFSLLNDSVCQINCSESDEIESLLINKCWEECIDSLYTIGKRITKNDNLTPERKKIGLKELEVYYLEIKKKISDTDSILIRKAFQNYGNNWSKSGDYSRVIYYLKIANQYYINNLESDTMATYVEYKLATAYDRLGDLENAAYYYELSIKILNHCHKFKALPNILNDFAKLQCSKNNIKESFNLYIRADSLSLFTKDTYNIIISKLGLIELYIILRDHSNAIKYWRNSTLLLPKLKSHPKYNKILTSYFKTGSNLNFTKVQKARSMILIDSAIFYIKKDPKFERRELSKLYLKRVDYFINRNLLDSAESNVKQAFILFYPNLDLNNIQDLYSIKNKENTLLSIFEKKAEILKQRFKISQDVATLRNSISYLDLALNINDELRSVYEYSNSQLLSIRENRRDINKAIIDLYYSYNLDNSNWCNSLIRKMLDRSKALLLQEKYEFYHNRIVTNQIDLNRIDSLSQLMAKWKLKNEDSEFTDPYFRTLLQSKIDICKNYDIKKFPKIYPENYIEYIITDTLAFIYAQLFNKIYFQKLGNKQLIDQKILSFQNYISNKNLSGNTKILFELDSILFPLNTKLPKEITIIPDNNISTIPFEILKRPNGKYWIEETTLCYNFAALINSNEGKPQSQIVENITAINPEYNKLNDSILAFERGGAYQLKYAGKEIESLKQTFAPEIHEYKNCNPEDFLSYLSTSGIFHFAGHTIIENDNIMLLVDTNQYFSMDVLSYANCPKDLVVLSACESGLGNWEVGEGIRSLAKTFHEAGCHSTLSSLWAVNDQSTSQIMSSFYQELMKGNSIVEALRNAKIEYLKEESGYNRHPYFWAGFVFYGENKYFTKKLSKTNYENYLFPTIIVFVLLVYLTLNRTEFNKLIKLNK